MVGCHLCGTHGCDDCLEKDAQMVTGKSNPKCINCGRDIIDKRYAGLCKICMQEDKQIPLAEKQEGGNGVHPA